MRRLVLTKGKIRRERGVLVHVVDTPMRRVVHSLPIPALEKVTADVGVGEDKGCADGTRGHEREWE